MPANGLLYATRQARACYYQSKLNGFNALAAGGKLFILTADGAVVCYQQRAARHGRLRATVRDSVARASSP